MSDLLEFQKMYFHFGLLMSFIFTLKYIIQNKFFKNWREENRKLKEENERLDKIIRLKKFNLYLKNETPIKSGEGACSKKYN